MVDMKTFSGIDLCYCLAARRSARALTRLYDGHLAPCGLSISQFSLLAMLERHPGITVAHLADLMVMERTTLVRALKPLQTQGLIQSAASGARSSLELSLSTSGIAKLREAEPVWQAAQQEWEGRVGEEQAVSVRDQIQQTELS